MSEDESVTFSSYGTAFQEAVMQSFLTDPVWAESMSEVFRTEYFDLKYLQYLGEKYFTYSTKYRAFPTLQLLLTIISDDLKSNANKALKDQVIDYLKRTRTNPNPGDLPFVKEKSLDFCKRQSLKEALEKSVDLINTEKYEAIVDVVRKAVISGTGATVGHDFFEQPDARFVKTHRNAVPTGLDVLDAKGILNGGHGAGEIGIVMASTGVGKSHFLTFVGANAMRRRKNVLHYTFELSETQIGIRYDSNLCDIASNEVQDSKEKVLDHYRSNTFGKLFIKEFPMHYATVNILRAHYEKLLVTKGVRPDLIIIDYADIMRSSRQYDSLRHELKLIYEELRAWAQEIKTPIWTASQTNRGAIDTDIVGVESISEDLGKAMTADLIISLSRKKMEKATGLGRLYVAKNRAGRDGLLYSLRIDTAKSVFEILGEETQESAEKENHDDMKSRMKKRWDGIHHTPVKVQPATQPDQQAEG